MRDDRQRLLDILEAIERIERYSSRGRDAFSGDELIQTWVVHHLQIIGEATRRLTDEFRAAHSDAPWSKIIGMRNLLVHAYFGIDRDIVWQVVDRDLPGAPGAHHRDRRRARRDEIAMSESSTVSLHTIENGEMTPTLKVRRHAITARYGALLEGLY